MLNHQTGKLLTVDQNDFTANLRDITPSIISESGCSNKDALIGSLSLKSACKLHYIGSTYRIVIPSLRLYINNIKAKFILLYYSIYSTIASPTDRLARISTRTAITHFDKQFYNDPLKKCW